jgi:transcriptional regulator NrdR family protein
VILCPLCGAKTHVLETRTTATSSRRRRGCTVAGCAGKVTTVEVAVREGRRSPLAKGSVVVAASQIAKLRALVASIDEGEL